MGRRRTLAFILAVTLIAAPLPTVRPAAAVAGDVYTATDIASLPTSLSLQTINSVSVPFQNGVPVPSLERQNGRTTFDLGGTWKKERVSLNHTYSLTNRSTSLAQIETEGGGRHTVGYNDSSWATKNLPGVENTLVGYEDRTARRSTRTGSGTGGRSRPAGDGPAST